MSSQKTRWSVTDESAARGDLRTLALATPALDEARLNALIRYQRALVDETPKTHATLRKGPEWEKAVARAHEAAVKAAGIDTLDLHRLEAMVADVCARARSLRELRQKRDEMATAKEDPERLQEVDGAIRKIESLSGLTGRYGEKTLALIQARIDELLALQEALRQTH